MIKYSFCMAAFLTLILAGVIRAGDDKAEAKLLLELNLVDGSRVLGTPGFASVLLQTSYVKLNIPLEQIHNIGIDVTHETASFRLRNGDRLTGVIGDTPIDLQTRFGKISVKTKLITRMSIRKFSRLPERASGKITCHPYGVFAVADFNNDGRPDVAVSDTTPNSESVDVYLNNGDGALILQKEYPVGSFPQHIATGDFDEDGDVDLIVAVYSGALGNGTMHVLRGNGDGTFVVGDGFSAKVGGRGVNPIRLAVGDLNKDGHLDFAVEMNNDWAVNVHWGKGDGTFTPKYSLPNGQNPGNTKIADLNHDDWPDIVSGSQYTCLFVHLSDGKGGYTAQIPYLQGTSTRQPIITGDLDRDGDIDILVANAAAHYVSVMINDGSGRFSEKGKVACPGSVGLAEVTDFDCDGKMDFVLSSNGKLLVMPGNGDGTFNTPVVHNLEGKVGPLQLHDLDGDGQQDFVYLDEESHQVVMQLNLSR